MKKTVLPHEDEHAILARMHAHNLINEAGAWTSYARQIACFRPVKEGRSPKEWAQAIASNQERHCVVCGSDMKGLHASSVFRPGGGKRCICTLCRHTHTLDEGGLARARTLT